MNCDELTTDQIEFINNKFEQLKSDILDRLLNVDIILRNGRFEKSFYYIEVLLPKNYLNVLLNGVFLRTEIYKKICETAGEEISTQFDGPKDLKSGDYIIDLYMMWGGKWYDTIGTTLDYEGDNILFNISIFCAPPRVDDELIDDDDIPL